MSGWISAKEKVPTEKRDYADHVHCWCAVKSSKNSTYFVEHLAWNPYHQCWDGEGEDDVSRFDLMVEFWQPLNIPEPPTASNNEFKATMPKCTTPERRSECHAYNAGACMNAFQCKP